MEKVAGRTLEEAWSELGLLKSIALALQLRAFIGILRSASSSTAGSLATGLCRSFWLEDRYRLPTRATIDNICSYINFWMAFVSLRKEIRKTASQHREQPENQISPASGLIFTHHDLAPRNILLDPSGDLWLIDWEDAGWYLVCFEYAAMHNFDIPQTWNQWARMRWILFCWIAAGFYDREARILQSVQSRCTRFPAARRFNMKASGYASAAGRTSDSS